MVGPAALTDNLHTPEAASSTIGQPAAALAEVVDTARSSFSQGLLDTAVDQIDEATSVLRGLRRTLSEMQRLHEMPVDRFF